MNIGERYGYEEDANCSFEFDEPNQPMVLNIYNILASASTGTEIDLDWLTENFGNSYYDPQEFPAARIDIRDKHSQYAITVSIFSNGKIQATGGSTIEFTKRALKKVVKRIKERGQEKARFLNFEVHNINAVIDSGFPVDLRVLRDIYEYVDYEPERNPGLKIRIPIIYIDDQDASPEYLQRKLLEHIYDFGNTRSKASSNILNEQGKIEVATLTIHFSGKVSISGARSIESLKKVLDYIKPFLIHAKLV